MSSKKKTKRATDELATRAFRNAPAWSRWLATHHASSPGIWVEQAKKDSGRPSISQREAVEVALCWGWIDGQALSKDATTWLQRFTPRRSQSRWSQINRKRALELIASGAMQPPGLAEVERAKRDGRWAAAYASPRAAVVPPDLRAALAKNAKARAFFAELDSRNRYSILHRIEAAKKPETRARRIADFTRMLAQKKKLHP